MQVGFVGLGVMGAPMAAHLLRAGYEVQVYNRTPQKAQPLLAQGAQQAPNLQSLAANCKRIFLCVRGSDDVTDLIRKLTPNAQPGTLFIDHSTISPPVAEGLHHALTEQGFRFLDAPITGGSMGAQNGTLTIFCGGNREVFEEAEVAMHSYGKRVELVGGPGAGQRMKMANQIAVVGALLGLCESLSFAQKAGLDLAQTREMLAGGAAGSWAFDHYGPKILNQDWRPGFSITNQVKDLHYCDEAAKAIGATIPMTLLARELLQSMIDQGRGEETTAALFEELLRRSG